MSSAAAKRRARSAAMRCSVSRFPDPSRTNGASPALARPVRAGTIVLGFRLCDAPVGRPRRRSGIPNPPRVRHGQTLRPRRRPALLAPAAMRAPAPVTTPGSNSPRWLDSCEPGRLCLDSDGATRQSADPGGVPGFRTRPAPAATNGSNSGAGSTRASRGLEFARFRPRDAPSPDPGDVLVGLSTLPFAQACRQVRGF